MNSILAVAVLILLAGLLVALPFFAVHLLLGRMGSAATGTLQISDLVTGAGPALLTATGDAGISRPSVRPLPSANPRPSYGA